jgi:D-alanine-D-alanine ligase
MIEKALKYLYESAHTRNEKVLITVICNVAELTNNFENYSHDSVESEFWTAEQYERILNGFRSEGFEANAYVDEEEFLKDVLAGTFYQIPNKTNVIFNSAQKGTAIGRKSLIPSFCDLLSLMHNNSNPYIVSLCRNKYHSGCLLEHWKLPSPSSWLYHHKVGWLLKQRPEQGTKVIMKLNYETSSIGLSDSNIFQYMDSSDAQIHMFSKTYNQEIIVQQFITGYEVEVPVIISSSSVSLDPMNINIDDAPLDDRILDYHLRKVQTYQYTHFSAINRTVDKEIRTTAVNAAQALGINGLGRIDFRVQKDGRFYITDVATNPGIGSNTATFHALRHYGYTYEQMLTILVGVVLDKYEKVL